MSEYKNIKVQLSDGTIIDRSIAITEIPPWGVVLPDCSITAYGRNLFDALISLREQLARKGERILCMGARPDVFVSSMSRDMGAARKAYIIRLGMPAQGGLVDIFDYTEPETICTVEEQLSFHQKWMDSLRRLI